jgi:8-oxo-dGTP pyrophosphatase MutT (NUDIX family)
MSSLQSVPAKVCLTAAGCLIHDGKVLLVKHKKLGFWLNPGGHIEPNELPHQAVEREFFEETGVKVRAITPPAYGQGTTDPTGQSEYLPLPIAANLHWVSKQNYEVRTSEAAQSDENHQKWGARGCEQHYGELYLVEPVAGTTFTEDTTETDGIEWFSVEEVEDLEMPENIRIELKRAFFLVSK